MQKIIPQNRAHFCFQYSKICKSKTKTVKIKHWKSSKYNRIRDKKSRSKSNRVCDFCFWDWKSKLFFMLFRSKIVALAQRSLISTANTTARPAFGIAIASARVYVCLCKRQQRQFLLKSTHMTILFPGTHTNLLCVCSKVDMTLASRLASVADWTNLHICRGHGHDTHLLYIFNMFDIYIF